MVKVISFVSAVALSFSMLVPQFVKAEDVENSNPVQIQNNLESSFVVFMNSATGEYIVMSSIDVNEMSPLELSEYLLSRLGEGRCVRMTGNFNAKGVDISENVSLTSIVDVPTFTYTHDGVVQTSTGGDRQISAITTETPDVITLPYTSTEDGSEASMLADAFSYTQYEYKVAGETILYPTYNSNAVSDPKEFLRIGKNLQFDVALPKDASLELKIATLQSLGLYGSFIKGKLPVSVSISFQNLGSSSIVAVRYRPQMVQVGGYWYTSALAKQKLGYATNAATIDIDLIFNTNAPIYYGIDGKVPTGYLDYATLLNREVTQSLGFQTSIHPSTGGLGNGDGSMPSVFDAWVSVGTEGYAITDLSNTSRATALVSNELYFAGEQVSKLNGGKPVQLYAPYVYQPLLTGLRWDTSVTLPTFMTPSYQTKISTIHPLDLALLADLGWDVPRVVNNDLLANVRELNFTSDVGSSSFYIFNPTTQNIHWSALGVPSWMRLTPDSRLMQPNENIAITVSVDSSDLSLSRSAQLFFISSQTTSSLNIYVTQNGVDTDLFDPLDNTRSGATFIDIDSIYIPSTAHVIGGTDQADWFKFDGKPGNVYVFQTQEVSPVDINIEIYKASLTKDILLASTDNLTSSREGKLIFVPDEIATFYIKVSPKSIPSASGKYTFHASVDLSMSIAYTVEPLLREVTFDAGTTTYTLKNTGASTLMWSINESIEWATAIYPNTGTLLPGQTATFTIMYTENTTRSSRMGQLGLDIEVADGLGAYRSLLTLTQYSTSDIYDDSLVAFELPNGVANYNSSVVIPLKGPLSTPNTLEFKVTGGTHGVDYLIKNYQRNDNGYFYFKTEDLVKDGGLFVYLLNQPAKKQIKLTFRLYDRKYAARVDRKNAKYVLTVAEYYGLKRQTTNLTAGEYPISSEEMYVAQVDRFGREGAIATGSNGFSSFISNESAPNGWLTHLLSVNNVTESLWVYSGRIFGPKDYIHIKDMFISGQRAKMYLRVLDPFKLDKYSSRVRTYTMSRIPYKYDLFKVNSTCKLYNSSQLSKFRKQGFPLAEVISKNMKDPNGNPAWVKTLGGELLYSLSGMGRRDRLGAVIMHVPTYSRITPQGSNVFTIEGKYFGTAPKAMIEMPYSNTYKTRTSKVKRLNYATDGSKVVTSVNVTITLPSSFSGDHIYLILISNIGYSQPIKFNVDANKNITLANN